MQLNGPFSIVFMLSETKRFHCFYKNKRRKILQKVQICNLSKCHKKKHLQVPNIKHINRHDYKDCLNLERNFLLCNTKCQMILLMKDRKIK